MKNHQYILISILALGFFLRIQGIDFALPFIYDEDESRRVNQAFLMLVNRDPNPHWFGHPASTLIYLLAGIYLVIFAIGSVLGFFANFNDFQQLYFNDPTIFYLSGRFFLIAFDLGNIIITYLIGKELGNKNIGLIAAFLIAIVPIQVKYAKVIRSDILMTFFLLLALYFCLKIFTKNDAKNYKLTGIFWGLAIVTKYPSAIFVVIIILVYLMNEKWEWTASKKLWITFKSCLITCFLASPFLFLDSGTAWRNLTHEARDGNVGANTEGFLNNLVWYWQNPLAYNLTNYSLILILVGLVFCVLFRNKKQIILGVFLITFYLFIASLSLRWDRWIIPLLPFACLLIASTLGQITTSLSKFKIGLMITIVYLVIVFHNLMFDNQREIKELLGQDTRTLGKEWILSNIPAGSSILVDEGTPPLPLDTFKLYQVRDGILTPIQPEDSRHVFIGVEIKEMGKLEDITEIAEQDIDYIITSWKYIKYLEEKEKYPQIVSTYQKIIDSAELVHELSRDNSQNITSGPKIQIYIIHQ